SSNCRQKPASVSNWFANARRRLKNTVRQPDLSWALRIKLYNKYVQGNAERLSISSDDTTSDGTDLGPTHKSVIQDSRGKGVGRSADPSVCDDYVSPPKYKNSLLNRYLNDSLRHVMASEKVMDSRKRNHSGSFSSNEYEDDFLSPSSEAEANFTYRTGKSCYKLSRFKNTYWKELHAAMALTNLAQGKESSTPGTTSCIIQKSSHIAEIKTVKVPIQPRH
uniref:Homeobox protein Mohawk-like n=1 Tax=Sinocyclocheilus rhinocerous TaxID=307959 RepID=A0A673IIP3_9TELE